MGLEMKFWIAFFLLVFLQDAQARTEQVSSVEDDGARTATYRPEPTHDSGSVGVNQEEVVEDAPAVIINPEMGGIPGGGLIRLDPKLDPNLNPKETPPTWWECCCNWIKSCFR